MEPSLLEQANKALTKVKISLLQQPDWIFLTTIGMSLEQKWNENIPTARTNGKAIEYNPTWFVSLAPNEREFLFLHEAMHVAYLHMLRDGDRDAKRWNAAADYVINDHLVAEGRAMPKGGLHDIQYRNMSTEQVYDMLEDDPDMDDSLLDLDPSSPSDPAEVETLRREVQDIVIRAKIQHDAAKSQGSIPGDLERLLERLSNPVLPWQSILRRFVSDRAKTEYTFRRPNRRYMPDHILPSRSGDALTEIVVAVDVSGSVSESDFIGFVSEAVGILKDIRPKKLTLLQFDYGIRSVDTLSSVGELKNLKFTGGGGTCVMETMDWIAKRRPAVSVVFSDGYFQMPNNPRVPVIWGIDGNPDFTAPFGQVIHYMREQP